MSTGFKILSGDRIVNDYMSTNIFRKEKIMENDHYEIHMNNGDVILYNEEDPDDMSLTIYEEYECALETNNMIVICDDTYRVHYIPACNISYITGF